MKAHIADRQPLHGASEDRHDVRPRRGLGVRPRARKLVWAGGADVVCKRDQLAAIRTPPSTNGIDLYAAAVIFFAVNTDIDVIDWAVPPDVACKIQDETIALVLGKPRPATNHLDV